MRAFPTLELLGTIPRSFTLACRHMFEKTTPISAEASSRTINEFRVETLDVGTRDLAEYRGRVVLVVNTASECGFTAWGTDNCGTGEHVLVDCVR